MRLTTTLSVTAALCVGCAVDPEPPTGLAHHELTCSNPEGIYGMEAALAVAVGNELGRWDGIADFTCATGRLALTPTGVAQCTARGGCSNVDAVLSMQDEMYFTNELGWVWNGDAFRQRMCIQWDRLRSAAERPVTDPTRCPSVPHTLTLDHLEADPAVCSLEAWFLIGGAAGSAVQCQMQLYDAPTNPWIAFQTAEGFVSVDPSDGVLRDASPDPATCWDASSGFVYDPAPKTKEGQCCVVAGQTKTLHAYTTKLDKCR